VPTGRGQRQEQILAAPGLATEDGMKSADVALAIDYDGPNTHTSLQALQKAGLVELVAGVTPQRWRLAPRYRTTSVVFMRMASRVRDGEWTTYGDISIAVRGDTKAARGVGQAAAALANFPHPERVLMDGGRINPKWRDRKDRGPDTAASCSNTKASGSRTISPTQPSGSRGTNCAAVMSPNRLSSDSAPASHPI
jgi:alkylated DNA nucleotide flippase Atl1